MTDQSIESAFGLAWVEARPKDERKRLAIFLPPSLYAALRVAAKLGPKDEDKGEVSRLIVRAVAEWVLANPEGKP